LKLKLEIGSPMACMYLLGNPDHYTKFDFVPVYWQSFVREAGNPWEQTPSHILKHSDIVKKEAHPEKLTIFKCNGHVVGFSPVHDYVYHP
ncbi:hypothetical protein L208DRAFT_1246924, partial [Tricholoma matsutake]